MARLNDVRRALSDLERLTDFLRASYPFREPADTSLVLAVPHQREAGYQL